MIIRKQYKNHSFIGRESMSKEPLGERKIVSLIHDIIGDSLSSSLLPFNDDAVAIEIGDKVLVINTDMFVRKTDAPPGMSARQIGQKVIVMNVSDLAAKGATPVGFLSALGIPADYGKNNIEELIRGFKEACSLYGVPYLGGDTNEADDLVIAGIALGITNKDELISRAGAQEGNLVCVTGMFGKTAAGFKILIDNLECPEYLRNEFIDAVFYPRARLDEGLALAKSRVPTASIDSSDGLAWSLHEIAKASNIGIEINKLPIDSSVEEFARRLSLDPFDLCFYGGEEFELIVTIPSEKAVHASTALNAVKGQLIPIGMVVKAEGLFYNEGEKTREIYPRGYEHFTKY
jgi:thiamine-monophosphate kinase